MKVIMSVIMFVLVFVMCTVWRDVSFMVLFQMQCGSTDAAGGQCSAEFATMAKFLKARSERGEWPNAPLRRQN